MKIQHSFVPVALCAWAVAGDVNECRTSWPGWKGIKYMFVFGDSYTQTGFNPSGIQPSLGNPLGNPPYPGWTSSNGPNWVDYLTVEYNSSNLLTYNFADGGATIDAKLAKPWKPEVLSLSDQVEKRYLKNYANKPPQAPWALSNSLFAFWIGINDVGDTYWEKNTSRVDKLFEKYTSLVEEVYQTGARNFVFLGVPPLERTPFTSGNKEKVELEVKAVKSWNSDLIKMSAALRARHPDTTSLVFQTIDVYNRVLDNPLSYPQTKGLKDTKDFCGVYPNMRSSTLDRYTQEMITRYPIPHGIADSRVVSNNGKNEVLLGEPGSCKYKNSEYFWYNDMHPTSPIHEATAAELSKLLAKWPSNTGKTCVANAQVVKTASGKVGRRTMGRKRRGDEGLHEFYES
ncbi:carbohydrate esterase family 16 protein [Venturia nashicola]|nr:carbohydrate esterase family 16 protein [Venturia nashicola]